MKNDNIMANESQKQDFLYSCAEEVIAGMNCCGSPKGLNKYRERVADAVAELADVPMSFRDEAAWNEYARTNVSSRGPSTCGARIQGHACLWARLMEKRMAEGEQLTKAAVEACDLEACNLFGLSGAEYAMSKACLIQCWKYGLDLQRILEAE